MGYRTGICYTQSGDKKMYEPDLFKAEVGVYTHERCYRHDSADSKTLVFQRDDRQDGFHAYLPYNGMSINHSIQDNGEEDHYTLLGSYEYRWPIHWSPPPGVDGPIYNTSRLKYPYYEYTYGFADYTTTWYNNAEHLLHNNILLGENSF